MTVLLLELNEINFDDVERYIALGKLPALARLIEHHGIVETTSEQTYKELEPWIQWVTAHTGRSFSEHGVFRLGDIVDKDLPQIWEVLESQGFRVGAVSPMNAKNRCSNAAFFVPDPWTPTPVTGSRLIRGISGAISQAVNNNATARIDLRSAAWLLAGLGRYARLRNWPRYLAQVAGAARGRPWKKALILDQLLADLFLKEVERAKPDFASLFLNAGAHIQHHYLFNAAVYRGPLRNPPWYVRSGDDPILDVYQLYDAIVGQVSSHFPNARLLLATGLHQNPHGHVTFYWRLKDHAAFLDMHGIEYESVAPLMSRDFVVRCCNAAQAQDAARSLKTVTTTEGKQLFDVDLRDDNLFVTLVWDADVPKGFQYRAGDQTHPDLRSSLAFVAIKNGEHDGTGYLIDTGRVREQGTTTPTMPLSALPALAAKACGGTWPEASGRAVSGVEPAVAAS